MKKIGFIGAGNMAGALIRGLLASQRYKPDDIWVSDPVDSQVRRLKRAHKVDGTRDNRLLVKQSQTVILAVKPQMMAAGARGDPRPRPRPKKLFISIAAGFPAAASGDRARRPGARRAGHAEHARPGRARASRWPSRAARPRPADLKQTLKLFKAVGEAVSITGEDLLDAVTALSGSGPGLRLPVRGEPHRGRGARRPAAEPGHPARLRDPRRRRGDAGRERALGARAARHGDLARAGPRWRAWGRSSSTTSAKR